jgi:hypothetical protein
MINLEVTPYHPTLDFPITNDPRSDKNVQREALKEKPFPDYLELEKEKQAWQEGRAPRQKGLWRDAL